MKTSISILIILLTMGLSGCKKEASSKIQIRIKNNTSLTFNKVFVDVNPQKTYTSIPPLGYSDYQNYDMAYRYNYVKVVTFNGEFIAQPIDFVGETPLKGGKHTYILTIENNNLMISYEKD